MDWVLYIFINKLQESHQIILKDFWHWLAGQPGSIATDGEGWKENCNMWVLKLIQNNVKASIIWVFHLFIFFELFVVGFDIWKRKVAERCFPFF